MEKNVVRKTLRESKKALISGITGQTGSYLAEYLLEQGYEVHGIIRRSSLIKTDRINHIFDKITLHYGDVTDGMNLLKLVKEIAPDEIYNMAAQSHVAVSFETPEYTANVDALGPLRFLEVIRLTDHTIKYYQASTSELYGDVKAPQSEAGPFQPRSPYAAAKLYAYWVTRNYREAYGLYAVNGILFNHESPRRGETFVTRKVTRWCADYINNKGDVPPLEIGNVWSVRDWTDARDMVKGIYKMMHLNDPSDFVLGSGEGRTIMALLHTAFSKCGIDLDWDNDLRQGIDKNTGKVVVKSVMKYFRPLEVNELIADTTKANEVLDWKPEISFDQMIAEMIEEDVVHTMS